MILWLWFENYTRRSWILGMYCFFALTLIVACSRLLIVGDERKKKRAREISEDCSLIFSRSPTFFARSLWPARAWNRLNWEPINTLLQPVVIIYLSFLPLITRKIASLIHVVKQSFSRLHSCSMSKDGWNMSPMHVTLKADVNQSRNSVAMWHFLDRENQDPFGLLLCLNPESESVITR